MATKNRTKSIPLANPGIDWSTLVLDPVEPAAAEPAPPAAPSGVMRRLLGDTTASVAQGAVQGVRMLSDVAGADNPVSTGLRTVEDYIGSLKTAEAKQDQQTIAALLQDAEGKGILDQVIAGAKAFGVAPLQTTAQALGTSVPTLATALIPGVGPMAVAARTAAGLGMGAAQGVGGVKSSIYDEVQQAALKAGAAPDEAARRAAWAQSYSGPNAAQIALGAGLGAWAGRSGIEGALDRLVHGSTKAAPGMAARVGLGAVAEGIPEAVQGGQEKFATNTALTNDGTPTDPWSGVAANATMEVLAGHAMGGLAGIPAPAVRPGDALRQDKLPERGPMTRAVNAVVEVAAQKADAGAPVPPAVAPTPPTAEVSAPGAAVPPDAAPAGPQGTGMTLAPGVETWAATPAAEPGAGAAPAEQAAPAAGAEQDPMYEQALAVVQASGKGSISDVQRHLRIGYNRAARILEQMELAGVLTPMDAAGRRTLAGAAPLEPDAEAARAQREADKPAEPTGEVLDGDILNAQGKPFKSMSVAMNELARAGGEATHEIKRVRGGLVVRPKVSAPASQPEPETTAAAQEAPSQAKPEAPASTFDMDGKPWRLESRNDRALVVLDEQGGKRTVAVGSKLGKKIEAAIAATGEDATAAAAVEKGTQDGQEEEGRLLKPRAGEAANQEQGASPQPPKQESIDTVPPAPRTVTVGGEQVALTPEQGAEWDRVDAEFKQKFADADAQFERDKKAGKPDDPDVGFRSAKEHRDAAKKALGFHLAAERRRITGKLTPKEQKAADQAAARIRPGDTVLTPQGTGTVTGVAFGKVRAEVDGKTVTVPHSEAKKAGPAPAAAPAVEADGVAAPPASAEIPQMDEPPPAATSAGGVKVRKSMREARNDAVLDRPVTEGGKQTTRRQWVESKVADGLGTRVTQEDRIKPMSRMAYFRANNEEQRAHDRKVKEGGKKDVYWIGDYEVTKIEHDYAERLKAERAAPVATLAPAPQLDNKAGKPKAEKPAPDAGQQDDTADDPEMAAYEAGLNAGTRANDKQKVAQSASDVDSMLGLGGYTDAERAKLAASGFKPSKAAGSIGEWYTGSGVNRVEVFKMGNRFIGSLKAGKRDTASGTDLSDVLQKLAAAHPGAGIAVDIQPPPTKPKPEASKNTVFTEDAAAAARARLKAKLGRLNSGIDPEMLMDGITLAGYHIEKGARTFAAYARAMVEDLGEGVKPYLQSWYMAVRADPRAAGFKGDMDKASVVEDLDIEQVLAAPAMPDPLELPKGITKQEREDAITGMYAAERERMGAELQRTMEAAGWAAETGDADNIYWSKRAAGERYTARLDREYRPFKMEVTALESGGVETQIAFFDVTDAAKAAAAADKAVADDKADSGPAPAAAPAQNAATKEKPDDRSTQPPVDAGDQDRGGAPGRGRGTPAQQPAAQGNPGAVEGAQPGDVEAPGGREPVAGAGQGAAGPDVGPAGGATAGRNAGDGRTRAGRKGAPDAGARGRGGRQAADGARTAPVDPATVSPANTGPGDFVIADPLRIVGGGQVARFDKNKAAIELRNRLVDAGRAPTREEQEVLAGYTGWGSFGQELFQGTWDRPAPKKGWEARDTWLRENLGQKDWEGMRDSIINAHYTDPPTVMAMWDMVRRMGFTGGRTLEPSIGIGNFYGLMPADMTARSQRAGIELDPVTGSMAQMLYPQANIQIKGYEASTTPDNFYDLVIGNWPFFEEGPADRRYNRLSPTLHDYFFLKAIDQTKPGGLIVGITTKGTMDKKGVNARMEMARKAELVAAFRLPSGAFEEYAGTKVVTDIIILRKRERPTDLVAGTGWIDVKDHDTAEGTKVPVNEYFHRNPTHVIGRIDYGHGTTTFRPGLIVHRPDDMMGQLRRIVDLVPEGAFRAGADTKRISYVANHTSDRTNALVKTDKGLFIVQGEYLAPANEVVKYELKDAAKTAKRVAELEALIDMRRLYAQLIDAERTGNAETQRTALRQAYEQFTKTSGPLADSFALGYLRKIDDPFYPSLAALEIGTEDANGKRTYRPAAILSQSTMRGAAAMKNPGITDAFVLARNQVVNPPLALIAEIAEKPQAEVKKALIDAGAAFELPNGDFAPSDIYLSGNVREKLREAKAALQAGNGAMQHNVDALTGVLPATIPYFKIETQMGATWVPARAYEQYVGHMLGMDNTEGIAVRFEGGLWKVELDGALNTRPQASSGSGVPHVRFKRLVRAAISNQTITVRRKDSDGNVYVDEDATKETNAAIADMRTKFGEWLWSDPTRRVELEAEYNEVRNAYATPRFDGTFLGFQGMALSLGRGPFNLRQHQANAIWRALVTRKSLNAHEVGTGKTFTMGGIAVESRRYGIAKKPLILAHNANSKSVAAKIQQMYPAAKVLYVDNLSKENVRTRMMQIANDDWDAVVVPHSLIGRIGFKEDTLMGMAKEEIADLETAAEEAAEEDGVKITGAMWDDEEELAKLRSPTAKQLVKQRLKIISTIKKLAQQASREDSVAFEDLGVDMVMVDEAHEFKKPPIATKMKMKGLQTATSDRSIALMFMTKYVRAMNGGANVHLFTGTPITNTMTEVFHMMRYMMQEEMATAAIADWDGWFGSFAREVSDVELNPAGEYEAVTRLQSFINVPELRRMIGQYMDVVFAEDMPEMQLRLVNGKRLTDKDLDETTRREILEGRTENAPDRPYKKVVNQNSDMTPDQLRVFEQVQGYARRWRSMSKKDRKDAMSRGAPESPIIHEGIAARASFDVRLVEAIRNAGKEGTPEMAPHPDSKPARVVANLLEIYRGHPLANQVVFMEQGMAKSVTRREGPAGQKRDVNYPAFSTVADMIERLVQAGVPREQIALVDGSTSKDKRKEIADAMNTGKIRIVFGSSDSLGVGVNMQRNLRAMHHMDAPWMPGELEQRNGRGHRQGNQWNTVYEYRYLTDRLDGRRWQVLAIKQKFITDFMKSKGDVRVIEGDAADDSGGDILATFSEAAGDPRLLLREKYKKKLEQLQSRERIHGNAVAEARRAVDDQTRYIADDEKELARIQKSGTKAAADALIQRTMGDGFTAEVDGEAFTERAPALEAMRKWITTNMRKKDERKQVGTFGGQPLYVEWRYVWSDEPTLVMDFPGGLQVTASPSWQSLEGRLRSMRDTVETSVEERIAERREKLAHARKVAVEPFHLKDKLDDAQQRLADLEADLDRNPVAPPYWLRAGAPMDTDVVYNGRTFTVTGHRWSETGYYVVAADERGEVSIPYTEAMDAQGMPLYEEHEFKPPVVIQTTGPQSVPAGGMRFGDAHRIDQDGGAWRVLDRGGKPFAGQPADGFKSKAEAQLWADTRPDPTAPADVDAARVAQARADWERDNGGPAPVFSRARGPNRGVPMADAKAVIAAIRAALPTAPPIHPLETLSQAPRALRDAIKAQGAEDLEAAYHAGEIYVFPRNIPSIERMQFVVGHHEIRHHGIRSRLGTGDDLGAAMHAMWAGNQALRKAAQAKLDAGLADARALAVEEALADMPVEEIVKFKGYQRLIAAVRQWLRQVAARLRNAKMPTLADLVEPKTWTDADVANFVIRAEGVSKGDTAIFRAGGTVFGRPSDQAAEGSSSSVFSRPGVTMDSARESTALTGEDLTATGDGGVFDFKRLGATKQDRIRTVIDKGRESFLAVLTRDQIADVYGAEIPPVKEYDALTRSMENERSKIAQDADDLYNKWAKLPADQSQALSRLMLDATVYGVHPDGEFTPNAEVAGTTLGERRRVHQSLAAQWNRLTPEARAIYSDVKGFHEAMLNKLRTGLEARLMRQVEDGQARAAALTKIRQTFDNYLKNGPYFPLSRFGDYIVVGTRDDGERVVSSYATAGEQATAAKALEAAGFRVKMTAAKSYSRENDGSAGKFIGDVLTTLNGLDMADAALGGGPANLKAKLMDDVNQLFIKALPDLSYRKHFLHRKNTPGFSSDMMRGFASSAFHAASHIARINHGDQMTFALQDAYSAIQQAPEGDFNLHVQVLNELAKRHDAALNPNTHPVAALLNQVGFVMYLGLSPAAGIVNMLQTVMVTMPHLGARYGFGKANASLAKALKDITTGAKANAKNGWNAAESLKLTTEERRMMSLLQDEGVIDLTQAHDLASATGLDTGNVARSKVSFGLARAMRIVGWTFHIPEVMNRQVAALSAYRLELEKSGDATAATNAAREAIRRTHFDYSASNRARVMQGNVARVALQFKQYSQNMTYLLGRALHQALKGETPEVKRIARRQLAATLGVTWAMAGAMGLPGIGTVAAIIGALAQGVGDDDEPWDWETEFRNAMADAFGKEAGEVISKGIPRALIPWDISGRVGLGDMWFRGGAREGDNPREAFATDMTAILGPTFGTLLGLYTAADHAGRGNWTKAVESMVPKALRDPIKAYREGTEGVTSYTGEPLMDVTAGEAIGQALGFGSARKAEMFAGRAAVMNTKTALDDKRKVLVAQIAKARLDGDLDTVREKWAEAQAFSQRNPEFKITGDTIRKAIQTRRRNRTNTVDGVLVPDTKASLRERGRFAVVD